MGPIIETLGGFERCRVDLDQHDGPARREVDRLELVDDLRGRFPRSVEFDRVTDGADDRAVLDDDVRRVLVVAQARQQFAGEVRGDRQAMHERVAIVATGCADPVQKG
ncbi:MAG: hypothetical protein M0Z51_08560 [Propionibacterium sp.]|nr:hypothetical protein [Propionibacterium sp.]